MYEAVRLIYDMTRRAEKPVHTVVQGSAQYMGGHKDKWTRR